jgi:hypothetical protein
MRFRGREDGKGSAVDYLLIFELFAIGGSKGYIVRTRPSAGSK